MSRPYKYSVYVAGKNASKPYKQYKTYAAMRKLVQTAPPRVFQIIERGSISHLFDRDITNEVYNALDAEHGEKVAKDINDRLAANNMPYFVRFMVSTMTYSVFKEGEEDNKLYADNMDEHAMRPYVMGFVHREAVDFVRDYQLATRSFTDDEIASGLRKMEWCGLLYRLEGFWGRLYRDFESNGLI